jgi:23S rRNA (pseudouridine1915-N3)-methyltransferase
MITFLWVDRTRERNLLALQEDYLSRIRRYEKRVEVLEVRPAKGGSAAERAGREGVALLERLPARGRRVALDERGDSMGTAEFARGLLERRGEGLTFVIGGPEGLPEGLLAHCDRRLALGPMTLPHELARVVLLEQVYRGLSLLAGSPYHRGGRAGRSP